MSRWFRFYDDAVHDPKLLKLSDGTFRMWVMLLCVASKEKGALPSVEDLGFYLRIKPARVAALIAELVAAGLLDKDGDTFSPHNWAGRQYQSDGSAERVKRHREKRAAAGLQSQWTAPKALRQAVYDRDSHKCVYCGSGERLSLDHRTPEIRGGTHDIENLATACLSCNGAKRDMTETEYRVSVTLLKRPQTTEQKAEQSRADACAFENDFLKRLSEVFGKPETELDRARVWLDKGYPPAMILETVREVLARGKDVGSLGYFDSILAERHANRPETPSERAAATVDMDKVAAFFKKTGVWSKYAGPEPGMTGCKCPADILAKHGIMVPGMRRMDA